LGEYLEIKQTAEENVKSVLTNSKILLKFAATSVIESLRRNHELYNFVSYNISDNNDTTSYESNSLSLMLPGQQQQQSFSDDIYTTLILEEAEKLYNNLTTKLTNEVMAAAAAIRAPSLPLPLPSANNNSQNLNYENDNTYDEVEEPRYNNRPEIYNNNQKQPNE
jgi:hypothetical protein